MHMQGWGRWSFCELQDQLRVSIHLTLDRSSAAVGSCFCKFERNGLPLGGGSSIEQSQQGMFRRGVMKMRLFLGCFVGLCLALSFSASGASGQAVFGSILGTVTDSQGSAVVGAKVTVTSVTKTTASETTTNESGNYTVSHLIPDTYNVRVEAAGFKAYEVKNVQVSADTSAKVDATMDVGAVTQSIEVTGEIPQLKTDRADVDIQFNEKYV